MSETPQPNTEDITQSKKERRTATLNQAQANRLGVPVGTKVSYEQRVGDEWGHTEYTYMSDIRDTKTGKSLGSGITVEKEQGKDPSELK